MYITDNPEVLVTKEVERYEFHNSSPYGGIVTAATQVPPSIMDSEVEDVMDIPVTRFSIVIEFTFRY